MIKLEIKTKVIPEVGKSKDLLNKIKEDHLEECLDKHLNWFEKWLRKYFKLNKWFNKYMTWKYNISQMSFQDDPFKYGVKIKEHEYIIHLSKIESHGSKD